jgi:hypothetical protein
MLNIQLEGFGHRNKNETASKRTGSYKRVGRKRNYRR